MRIAWFTPLSRTSAIGRFSEAVVNSLSRLVEVDLCHFDSKQVRETTVPTKRFVAADLVSLRMLSNYDAVVYNFGNYFPFHGEIFKLATLWPGISVVHDFVMHHFFVDYYLNNHRDPDGYRSLLERTYGEGAPLPQDRIWQTDDVMQYPLFEEIAHNSQGVITHSEFFRRRVQQCFTGPITRIPLAYTAEPRSREACRARLSLTDNQILVLTVGHVNPNKQIESVLHALGRMGTSLKDTIYAIVGQASPDYLHRLKAAAKERKIGHAVRFVGEVTDEMLRTYLSAADICVNLRFPSMEGASASAIEEMLFGKSVIVTDTGFFSELPQDCVLKVQHGDDAALENALARLISSAELRQALGDRAKAFAEPEFHPDAYAKRAIDFIWEVRSAKPILDLTDRIGTELRKMGVHAEMGIVERVANEVGNTLVGKSEMLSSPIADLKPSNVCKP